MTCIHPADRGARPIAGIVAGCAAPGRGQARALARRGRTPAASFDHLVGTGDERGWDREAEQACGPLMLSTSSGELLDHLVRSGEEGWRKFEPDLPSGAEAEDEIELRR